MRRFSLALALLLLLMTALSAGAADSYHGQFKMTNGTANGHVTITRAASGDYQVKITVWGLTPGSAHAMHFHRGTCSAAGGVIQALPPAVANRGGIATVTAWLSWSQWKTITSASTYVNIHERATAPIGGGITCADVGAG